jgi:hypothetical protein
MKKRNTISFRLNQNNTNSDRINDKRKSHKIRELNLGINQQSINEYIDKFQNITSTNKLINSIAIVN